MSDEQLEWVILGVMETGEVFDVPGWPDRLCDMLADREQNNRVIYSTYLQPVHINSIPSVVVKRRLAQDDPSSFAIVTQFVAENRLKTRAGRSGKYPAFNPERRGYIKG